MLVVPSVTSSIPQVLIKHVPILPRHDTGVSTGINLCIVFLTLNASFNVKTGKQTGSLCKVLANSSFELAFCQL